MQKSSVKFPIIYVQFFMDKKKFDNQHYPEIWIITLIFEIILKTEMIIANTKALTLYNKLYTTFSS